MAPTTPTTVDPNAAAASNEQAEKTKKIIKEILELNSLNLSENEKINQSLGNTAGLYRNINGELELTISAFAKTKQQIAETNNKINEQLGNLTKISSEQMPIMEAALKRKKELEDQGYASTSEEIVAQEEIIKNANNQVETEKNKLKELKKNLDNLLLQKKAQEEISQVGRSFVNDILNSQIVKTFTLSGIYSNIKGQLLSIVSANEQFARTTGMLAQDMVDASAVQNLSQYGIGIADLTKSTGALVGSMASFTNQTPQVQSQLSATAAKFENLNVSAAESGAVFDIFTKTLNIAGQDASATLETMAKTAQGIGMAPAAMIKDFSSVMPLLAANGKRALDVFYSLEKQAKSLGMSINDLVSIAEGFDTFENAAQKTAVLNSMLGGNYLNSLELVQASEEERIDLIKQGFDLSGKQFEDLDRATQKSIAQTLGFKNAGDAARYFNSSTSDMRIEQMKTEATQAKLNEAMTQAAEIGKQLENVFSKIVIGLKPAIEFVKKMVVAFSELNDMSGGIIGVIAAIVVVVVTMGIAFASIIAPIITAGTSLLTFAGQSTVASAGLAATITTVSTAFAAGLKIIGTAAAAPEVAVGLVIATIVLLALAAVMVSIGLAALGIGAGIMLAAKGIVLLIEAFKNLGDQAFKVSGYLLGFLATFALFVAGMAALTIPGYVASLVLLAIGAGAMLLGAGIFLAAAGMAKFVDAIRTLADKKADIKEAMDLFSDIGGVMVHMQNVNEVFVTMATNIARVVSGLKELSTVMAGFKTNTNISDFSAQISTISQSMVLPTGDVGSFVETINSVSKVLESASKVTTEKINISKEFIKETVQTASNQGAANVNKSQSGMQNIQVNVYLDGKEIAKNIKIDKKDRTVADSVNRGSKELE
jgi:hypothetical protein